MPNSSLLLPYHDERPLLVLVIERGELDSLFDVQSMIEAVPGVHRRRTALAGHIHAWAHKEKERVATL